MTREVMRYKLNELRMMLNDGEHGEEQGILVDIIKELDKAENKGEWIYKNPFDTLPYCSKCDKEPDVEFLGILPNTCPNCGADMRGVSE